jgi:hypothetical protein
MAKADDDVVRSVVEIAETIRGNPFAYRKEGEDEVRRALREGRILYDPPWAFSVPRPGSRPAEVDRWISDVADDIQADDPSMSRVEAEERARDMLAWKWRHSSGSLTEDDFREAEAAAALIERQTGVSRARALGRVLRDLRESRVAQGLRSLAERPLPTQRIGK